MTDKWEPPGKPNPKEMERPVGENKKAKYVELNARDVGYKCPAASGTARFFDYMTPEINALHAISFIESGFVGLFSNATPVCKDELGTLHKDYAGINLVNGEVSFYTGEVILDEYLIKKKPIPETYFCPYIDQTKLIKYYTLVEPIDEPPVKIKRFKPRKIAYYDQGSGNYYGFFNHYFQQEVDVKGKSFFRSDMEVHAELFYQGKTALINLRLKIEELEKEISDLKERVTSVEGKL